MDDNDGDLDLYLLNYPINFTYTNKIEAQLIQTKRPIRPYSIPRKAPYRPFL